jgi:hypothetical protein
MTDAPLHVAVAFPKVDSMDPATLKTAETTIGTVWKYRAIFCIGSVLRVAKRERTRCEELLGATAECLIAFENMDQETRDFRAPLGMGSTGTGPRMLRQYLNDLEHTYREFKWSLAILISLPLLNLSMAARPASTASEESELKDFENQIDGPISGMRCLSDLPTHCRTLGWIMKRGTFKDLERKLAVADAWRNLPPIAIR